MSFSNGFVNPALVFVTNTKRGVHDVDVSQIDSPVFEAFVFDKPAHDGGHDEGVRDVE